MDYHDITRRRSLDAYMIWGEIFTRFVGICGAGIQTTKIVASIRGEQPLMFFSRYVRTLL